MRTLIIILLMALAGQVGADSLFVKTDGDDAANGLSYATAKKTTAGVMAIHSGGDTIVYAPGKYYGYWEVLNGTNGDRTCVTCSAWADPPPCTLSMALQLGDSTWTQSALGVNIYYATVTPPDNWTDFTTPPSPTENYCWTLGIDDSLQTNACASNDIGTCNAMDSTDVDAQGEFYWDASEDLLYMWAHDDRDMTSAPGEIEASFIPVVWNNNAAHGTHATFSRLVIEYGSHKVVFGNGAGTAPDSFFVDSCYLGYVGGQNAQNTAAYGTARISNDSSDNMHYPRLYGCNLHHVKDAVDNGNHYAAITTYSWTAGTIDSCIIGDSPLGIGINIKSAGSGPTQWANIIRNNVISNCISPIIFLTNYHADSIYGNYIVQNASGNTNGIAFGSVEPDGPMYIFNNTFIMRGGDKGVATGFQSATVWPDGNEMFGNIFYATGASRPAVLQLDREVDSIVVDTNLYYATAGAFTFTIDTGNGNETATFAEWISDFGHDTDTVITINPSFDSVGAADIRAGLQRTGVSAEMSRTFGGKTWTIMGAAQPSAEAAGRVETINNVITSGSVESKQ